MQPSLVLYLTQLILIIAERKKMSTQSQKTMWQNELLTVKEVAVHLRLSRVTVWRWCQQGIIPAVRVGRNWRIQQHDLLKILETCQPPDLSLIPFSPSSEKNGRGGT